MGLEKTTPKRSRKFHAAWNCEGGEPLAQCFSKVLPSSPAGFTSRRAPFAQGATTSSRRWSYLKQIEIESNICFRDTRHSSNHRRALANWPTPDGLLGRLEIDEEAATAALKQQTSLPRAETPPSLLSRAGLLTENFRLTRRGERRLRF
jgi:hypothetical protein